MSKTEAFLSIVGFLVVVLGYIWRRLGEKPPPPQTPTGKETNLDG